MGGHLGGQQRYSDLAVVTTLTLRTVFQLALRQAEGFVASLIRRMALDLKAPYHTTLSRRSASVVVPPPVPAYAGPIRLVIASTDLKMVGDWEWHVIKHKPARKRRCWRKLHLGVDVGGFIVASELSESRVDDASVGVAIILGNTGITRITADGAYDTRAIYEAATAVGCVEVVIPPRREATRSPRDEVFRHRDAEIGRIAEVGRRRCRKEAGAHWQARAESVMLRNKRIIWEALRARRMTTQTTETRIAVNIINRLAVIGKPASLALLG